MIVLNLCCNSEHRFEGWFASADDFETQSARGLVSCPVCGDAAIRRLPSAPYVQTRNAQPPAAEPQAAPGGTLAPEAAAAVIKALREMARTADDVGRDFPEEARRIHYGEVEARNIRGAASPDEVGELLEEGIMVLPVPPGDDKLH